MQQKTNATNYTPLQSTSRERKYVLQLCMFTTLHITLVSSAFVFVSDLLNLPGEDPQKDLSEQTLFD